MISKEHIKYFENIYHTFLKKPYINLWRYFSLSDQFVRSILKGYICTHFFITWGLIQKNRRY